MELIIQTLLLKMVLNNTSARLTMDSEDMAHIAAVVRVSFPDVECLRVVASGSPSRHLIPSLLSACSCAVHLSPVRVGCSGNVLLTDRLSDLSHMTPVLQLSAIDRVLVITMADETNASLSNLSLDVFGGAMVAVSLSGRLYHLGPRGLELLQSPARVFAAPSYILPDLQGRHLRVATFYCPPFSYGVPKPRNSTDAKFGIDYDGIEMGIFLLLSRRLNFSWEMFAPTGDRRWGKLLDNGSWTGGITGDLATGRVDVAFCYLWASITGYLYVDFTFPWTHICNIMLVPRPTKLIFWKAVLLPLEASVWAATIIASGLVAATFCVLARADVAHPSPLRHLDNSVLITVGMLVLTSYSPEYYHVARIKPVLFSWLWFALLVTTAYSSKLMARLTVPTFSAPFNSAEDLVNAGIDWEETYVPYVQMIFNPDNPWHDKLIKRFHCLPEEEQSVIKDRFATMGIRISGTSEYVHPTHELSSESLYGLRVMRECLSNYYVSIGLTKFSTLTEPFDRAINRMRETGVVAYIQQDVMRRRSDPVLTQRLLELSYDWTDGAEPEPLHVQNLVGAFILWTIGVGVSSTAFILECIINRLKHSTSMQALSREV